LLIGVGLTATVQPAEPPTAAKSADLVFEHTVRPLLSRYCVDCHGPELAEAEIDLAGFTTVEQVRRNVAVWQKLAEALDSGQMPPPDAKQPATEERTALLGWTRSLLTREAAAHAGDPGPVVLRRLSNAEYTYTLRDLTGLETLDPAKEFPVDSAAGEGFTNVGQALVMSPALVTKYLDAAKRVAEHAAFVSDGVRFSPYTTRRDWTNERLAAIRRLYQRYTTEGGGQGVNLQGIQFQTNQGGRLPIERYLLATLEERTRLRAGPPSAFEEVARERLLSPRYLTRLWTRLESSDAAAADAWIFHPLQTAWSTATPADVPLLLAFITTWQSDLWKFQPVGQIGIHPAIHEWQAPVDPGATRREFRVKLPPTTPDGGLPITLSVSDVGDGGAHDQVVWERPRLVAPGRPDLLLRDVPRVAQAVQTDRARHFTQAATALAAAAEARRASDHVDLAALSAKHRVDRDSLTAWLEYLGIATGARVELGPLLQRKLESAAGYDFIQGWIGDDALSIVANSSDQAVRIPGHMKPHGVAVHPSPSLAIGVGWRSPVAATLAISGSIQHAHPECGNGVRFWLEFRRGPSRLRLAEGLAQGGNPVAIGPLADITVRPDDVLALVIDPRDGNHSCDLTAIDLTLSDGTRTWDLARELSPHLLAGNPHADSLGHPDVWHFYTEPAGGAAGPVLPAGSLLAQWQATDDPQRQQQLATDLQRLLSRDPATLEPNTPDSLLVEQLRSLSGPFTTAILQAVQAADASTIATDDRWGLPAARFGGPGVDPASLLLTSSGDLSFRLPPELVVGAEFVTTATMDPVQGVGGVARVAVQTDVAVSPSSPGPVLVSGDASTQAGLNAACAAFRELFPVALCYPQIVPVDEVVTLTLYYREDGRLRDLMLDAAEAAELDRLWDELLYLAQEPRELVTAITQLYQFATQDRSDLLEPIATLQGIVQARAEAFERQLLDDEPRQLASVLAFVATAYRRPLATEEATQLHALYATLREEGLDHEAALRMLLARILVSPAFLYRLEVPGPGTTAGPVSDLELASRLSYFLWSSAPDDRLRDLALAGRLHDDAVLAEETRRMLRDPKARRLAIEFGCHWLHIHGFDQLDEKSERHFPTFAGLRDDMYEEAIRVLTELFQENRSLLSLVDGDATFLNAELAAHYGIPEVEGPEWRRVTGVRAQGRGGILGLSATLAKHAGASRTSPILRGTWLSEVLLGEKLPKPPKDVPPLAETVTEGLTERQMTELHSREPACAKCHVRVDPFGFALEAFDAIGRYRTQDAAGLPIDTRTTLPDGTAIRGAEELRHYLVTTRRDAFVRQFTKKLLGYALGRATRLSDEPFLNELQTRLAANDHRVETAVLAIVHSPQFRNIRGHDMVDE
jgi:hypothetical protein